LAESEEIVSGGDALGELGLHSSLGLQALKTALPPEGCAGNRQVKRKSAVRIFITAVKRTRIGSTRASAAG
jgi:hypothetical protein